MYWYVLFVKAGKERKIEEYLKKQLNEDVGIPFIPLQEILFKRSGIMKKETRFLFPGYVFIDSMLANQEFMKEINSLINKCSDIISLLKIGRAHV